MFRSTILKTTVTYMTLKMMNSYQQENGSCARLVDKSIAIHDSDGLGILINIV